MRYLILALHVWAFVNHAVAADSPPPLRLVHSVELAGERGRLDHFGSDRDGQRLFVSNQGNSSLDVIDVKAAKVIKQVSGQKRIHGIAHEPKTGRIFVGNGDPGECAVIDGRTYEVLKRIPISKADNVQYDSHSGRIFVGHVALTAVDPMTMAIVKEISTPGALRAFRIDPKTPRLFANAVTGEVCVVDTLAPAPLTNFKLQDADGNAAMALDPDNRRIFIGCRSTPKLLVLDLNSGAEVARLDLPAGIDDMWFDSVGKRIYASTGDGEIAVVAQRDANQYVRLPGVSAAKMARTCFFDAASRRLYLGVPGTADSPTKIEIYEAAE